MNIHKLMPVPHCENDVRGRFTKSPLDDSHSMIPSCLVLSWFCAPLPGSSVTDRAKRGRTGATPLFEALVRAWAGVGFHKLRTGPWGSLPFASILAGRQSSR